MGIMINFVRVLVLVLVFVVLLLVTGVKQSQLLDLRISLEFDKMKRNIKNAQLSMSGIHSIS